MLLAACATQTGQNGFYTVEKGDTLASIGRAFDVSYRDLTKWNKLADKDVIQVGQVLRIRPPATVKRSSQATVKSAAAKSAVSASAASQSQKKSTAAAGTPQNWLWPADGKTTVASEHNRKGIDIAGIVGQPVLAAAGGKVIYVGVGIRGYGNMVIVRHNEAQLSVYAHNRTVLVKEGQQVRRGQRIAEMGNTDSKTVKLYFEIRINGNPVGPLTLLPPR